MHERGGEVEPPAHPAGEVAQQPVARVDEVEPLEQLVDAAGESDFGTCVSRPTRRRFSRAVRFSSTAAY